MAAIGFIIGGGRFLETGESILSVVREIVRLFLRERLVENLFAVFPFWSKTRSSHSSRSSLVFAKI